MPDFNPSDSARTLFGSLEAASQFPRESVIREGTALLDRLLEGRPVDPDLLIRETDLSEDEMESLLTGLEAERNEDGEILGLGLSLRPTPHQYLAEGKIFYAWCAADTLLFPALLDHTARVTSRDPATGDAIKLTVSPNAVEDLDPHSAAVTWAEDVHPSSLRETFCRPTRFFANADAAQQWADRTEETTVLSIEEAHEAARPLADRVKNGSFSC